MNRSPSDLRIRSAVRLLGSAALIALLSGCATTSEPNIQTASVSTTAETSKSGRKTLVSHLKERSRQKASEPLPGNGAPASLGTDAIETASTAVDDATEALATAPIDESTVAPTSTARAIEAAKSRSQGNRKTLFGWLSKGRDKTSGTTDPVTTAAVPNGEDVGLKGEEDNSLSEIVQQTLSTNPDIRIADAQLDDARAAVEIERSATRPEVDLIVQTGVENVYSESSANEAGHRSEMNVAVNHVLFDFGSRDRAIDRRNILVESAKLRKQDKNQEISLKVVEAYLDYRRSVDLLAAAGKNVSEHERIVRLVQLNEEGGNASVADVKRAETRLEAAKSERISLSNAQEDAVAAFRRLTGVSPEDVAAPKELAPEGKVRELKDLETLIRSNPQLRSVLADRRSLEEQWMQQHKTARPEIYLRGEANYKNNAGGDTGLTSDVKGMIGFRVKLFDGGRRDSTLEQIDARIRETDARHEKLYRELLQQMEQNNQALATSTEKQAFLDDQVDAAERAMALYREQFEAGERTPFELLDAQRDVYRARSELINHRYDAAASIYRNLRLNGSLTTQMMLFQ